MNTSIIIVSFNTLDKTKQCLESIRKTCDMSTVEIVVVDNASKDGSVEFLRNQSDIVLVERDKNLGFPGGVNVGIKAANPKNDIFLLNSDTILMENSLSILKQVLYSDEKIGAAGSCSNEAVPAQMIDRRFGSIEEYAAFGSLNNVIRDNCIEYKTWLMGHALLIKRSVLDKVGYLDEIYTPGNYEDDDLGIRIGLLGYKNALCWNSFIFHYGSESFKSSEGMEKRAALLKTNEEKYFKKWGQKALYYTHCRPDLTLMLSVPDKKEFCVLELGAQSGNTLSNIKYKYPNARVYGTETEERACNLASLKFECKRVANLLEIPYEEKFDVILMDEKIGNISDFNGLLLRIKQSLAPGGYALLSIPNSRNLGNTDYKYPKTYEEILTAIEKCGLDTKGDVMFIAEDNPQEEDIHRRIVQYIFKVC